MKLNDKRIAHLRNLGNNRDEAIKTLEIEMQKNPDFLEVAEISFSHETRDGGLRHNEIAYVAGICGCKEAKSKSDSSDDIYHLVYFNEMVQTKDAAWHPEGNIYSNSLECISQYQPFNKKL
jgi:phosphopantetheinyl transferase (holo-ACP synthase)